MKRGYLRALGLLLVFAMPEPALASLYNQIFVFGDSFSDNDYSNGPTAVSYLATALGLTLTQSLDPAAKTNPSINFAVTGANVGKDNAGLLTQVADFRDRTVSGEVSFAPETSLFF